MECTVMRRIICFLLCKVADDQGNVQSILSGITCTTLKVEKHGFRPNYLPKLGRINYALPTSSGFTVKKTIDNRFFPGSFIALIFSITVFTNTAIWEMMIGERRSMYSYEILVWTQYMTLIDKGTDLWHVQVQSTYCPARLLFNFDLSLFWWPRNDLFKTTICL